VTTRPDRFMSFPGKMPFEDLVLRYLTDHPGRTPEDCSRDLGVGAAAVWVACQSLVNKGVVAWDDAEVGTP
jgi:hypothetical protein